MTGKEIIVRKDLLFQQLGSYLALLSVVFTLPFALSLALEYADFGTVLLVVVSCFVVPPFFAYFWAFFYVRTVQYTLYKNRLEVEQGILFKVHKNIPLNKITHILVMEGPFERALGLKSIKIYTAGSTGSRPAAVLRGLDQESKEGLVSALGRF